jgi:RHS repeat-associated protein
MQTNSSTTVLHICAFAYKLTGKERDSESGLDYFGARYYARNMGRFMSPDWSARSFPPFSITRQMRKKLEAIHFVRQHYENWNNHRQLYRTRKTDSGPALKLSRSLMRFPASAGCFWFQV